MAEILLFYKLGQNVHHKYPDGDICEESLVPSARLELARP